MAVLLLIIVMAMAMIVVMRIMRQMAVILTVIVEETIRCRRYR
jgi:hypothetical protein